MALNWTLVHSGLTNDESDGAGDIGEVAAVGWLHFVAQIEDGMSALAPAVGETGASYWVRTFYGYLDSDGVLKNKPGAEGGTPGVRLWANDPKFNLEKLPYLVYAPDGLKANGKRFPFAAFTFDAPSEDVEKKFSELQPVPSAKAQGIARGPRSRLRRVPGDGPPRYRWQDEMGLYFGEEEDFADVFADSADVATAAAAPDAVAAVAPAAVSADIAERGFDKIDNGDGSYTVTLGGQPFVGPLSAASGVWSGIAGIPALPRLFERPTAFTWDWGFGIYWDGRRFGTDFDVAVRRNKSTKTIWVNSVAGSDTVGQGDGSAARPYRSFDTAYAAAVDGDTIKLGNPGLFFTNRWTGTALSKSINLIAAFPLQTFLIVANNHAETARWASNTTYPLVYEAARTNVRKVVDFSLDPEGAEYTRVTTLADCNTTRGSWYQAADGTGPVYVRTINSAAPNPATLFPLLALNGLSVTAAGRTSDLDIYIEGVILVGGMGSFRVRPDSAYKIRFTAKDTWILHGGYGPVGTTAGALSDGFSAEGNVEIYLQRVRSAHTCLDGFNYTGASCRFVEIDVIAHKLGSDQLPQSLGVSTAQNASTAHEGAMGLRLGGEYEESYGTLIGDVQDGTKTINLSNRVGNTANPGPGDTSHRCAFYTQSGFDTEMWVYGAIVYGIAFGLWSDDGCTIHYDAMTAETATLANVGGTYQLESMR